MRTLREVALPAIFVLPGTALTGCEDQSKEDKAPTAVSDKVVKTDEAWKARLTPEQYRILRTKGTERAFSGKYWNHTGNGVYRCAGCGRELFNSQTKFKSGTGWPSFTAPIDTGNVSEEPDTSLSMKRTEVLCSRCGGHLGHVFNDGPEPTGRRYCINSAALDFVAKDEGAGK